MSGRIAVLALVWLVLGIGTVGMSAAGLAAPIGDYPDADAETHCTSSGESPECALKTFWACTEKSVATCNKVGLDVQADGTQYKADQTMEGDVWSQPWTMSWAELLDVTNPAYTIWEVRGFRQIAPNRLRGVPSSRRGLAGTHEVMIGMVDEKGQELKQSVFLTQRKGQWMATGFARWKGADFINLCQKRKLGSLGCRYTVTNLAVWTITETLLPPPPAPPPEAAPDVAPETAPVPPVVTPTAAPVAVPAPKAPKPAAPVATPAVVAPVAAPAKPAATPTPPPTPAPTPATSPAQ